MQTATTDLTAALQRLGEVVYSQSAGPAEGGEGPEDGSGPSAESDEPSDDSGTVEGEFREV